MGNVPAAAVALCALTHSRRPWPPPGAGVGRGTGSSRRLLAVFERHCRGLLGCLTRQVSDAVGGWPYRPLLTVIGLGVVMLSVTGMDLWWKKRHGRQRSRAGVATIPATGTASAPPAPIPAAARAHPEPPHAAPGH